MKFKNKKTNYLSQSFLIVRSQNNFVSGLRRLKDVIKEIWIFDWKRPGVRTGFQQINSELEADYMWYSPTETSVCFSILKFTKDWVRSYFEYSSQNTPVVFVDFGAGAGKTNLIAIELGYTLSIAFEIDSQLVKVADNNFSVPRYSKIHQKRIQSFTGDVTNINHVKELRKLIQSLIPESRHFLLVAYNKNSYGPRALEKSILALDQEFGTYVYLYQNPVHKKVLERLGLNIHRHIQDPHLKKNRDWLIATRD